MTAEEERMVARDIATALAYIPDREKVDVLLAGAAMYAQIVEMEDGEWVAEAVEAYYMAAHVAAKGALQ